MASNQFRSESIKAPLLEQAEQGHSLWQDAWYRLRKNHMAVAGGIFISLMILTSVFGPMLVQHGYQEQNLELRESAPSAEHWLGTDKLGRDLLSRVLYGGRISLTVGLVATAVSLTIGVLYGTIAGYCGGKTDAVMMRFVDILYALPFTIFVILLMVFFGRDIRLMFLAIGAVEWLTMARIVRGQVLSLRKQEFIEACIALGLPMWKIIIRHLAPNVIGPV
ncbi:MAG: ABC transporter permease, partial [Verrucomicrobia bacterium]|nr:ABC transporter permease [Verrucomicrobiota bacterium]